MQNVKSDMWEKQQILSAMRTSELLYQTNLNINEMEIFAASKRLKN